MIAMQYSFVLPADYDMSIIERRVRERGHIFDDTPAAFEPRDWTLVRFRLWREAAQIPRRSGLQVYDVLHVSNPAGL